MYARPMTYTDSSKHETHGVTEDMIKMSDKYLSLYPRTIDPSKIDASSLINSYKLFNEKEKASDIKDALKHNVFWSTTEDETGVYLFTRGSLLTAPKRVKGTDGKPIRVNFEDTYTPKDMPEFNRRYFREHPPRTDDTWFDNMFNHNFGG